MVVYLMVFDGGLPPHCHTHDATPSPPLTMHTSLKPSQVSHRESFLIHKQ